jgi:hypothetical protein
MIQQIFAIITIFIVPSFAQKCPNLPCYQFCEKPNPAIEKVSIGVITINTDQISTNFKKPAKDLITIKDFELTEVCFLQIKTNLIQGRIAFLTKMCLHILGRFS